MLDTGYWMLVMPVLFKRRMLQGYWMLDAGNAGVV
jgi:hypothetical protein